MLMQRCLPSGGHFRVHPDVVAVAHRFVSIACLNIDVVGSTHKVRSTGGGYSRATGPNLASVQLNVKARNVVRDESAFDSPAGLEVGWAVRWIENPVLHSAQKIRIALTDRGVGGNRLFCPHNPSVIAAGGIRFEIEANIALPGHSAGDRMKETPASRGDRGGED